MDVDAEHLHTLPTSGSPGDEECLCDQEKVVALRDRLLARIAVEQDMSIDAHDGFGSTITIEVRSAPQLHAAMTVGESILVVPMELSANRQQIAFLSRSYSLNARTQMVCSVSFARSIDGWCPIRVPEGMHSVVTVVTNEIGPHE
jgi:hypothetical protein